MNEKLSEASKAVIASAQNLKKILNERVIRISDVDKHDIFLRRKDKKPSKKK